MKCPMVYERVGGLVASARAVLRRSAVYGSLVPPGDPGLLESGNACSICQARSPYHMPNPLRAAHVVTGFLWCHRDLWGADVATRCLWSAPSGVVTEWCLAGCAACAVAK